MQGPERLLWDWAVGRTVGGGYGQPMSPTSPTPDPLPLLPQSQQRPGAASLPGRRLTGGPLCPSPQTVPLQRDFRFRVQRACHLAPPQQPLDLERGPHLPRPPQASLPH